MKKVIILGVMCLMALTMYAQKCAVLEFRGSKSVSVSDVDGISEMFMTYFRPAGYTMVERAQIDMVISEQGFQHSSITDAQAVRLGKILNVSKVVLGKVSRLGGQYQVDVRVVDVQSGHDVAMEGATFSGDYRTNVRNLATRLGKKLANGSGLGGGSGVNPPQKNVAQGYTDLGLPSGTIWKDFNATGFYTYDEAISQFGNRLPTKAQWEELKAECQWSWTGSGYKVTGPNGNSISLPAAGARLCDGSVGSSGDYWSSTPEGSENAWRLTFDSGSVGMYYISARCDGRSVRLVQNP